MKGGKKGGQSKKGGGKKGPSQPSRQAGLPPSLMSLAMNFSRSLTALAAAASAFCAAFTSATFCSSGVRTFASSAIIEPKMQHSPNYLALCWQGAPP